MGHSVVEAFPTLTEAQIACSALRAAGFEAQVLDERLGAVIPTGVLGDFRLVVPDADRYEAQTVLAALKRAAAGET